jgi:predicted transcriptional regulator
MDQPASPTLGPTARIISAYVSSNRLASTDLPMLIRTVHDVLNGAAHGPGPVARETAKPSAAQIRRSIRPDALVSFLDGKAYKTLRRHLRGRGVSEGDYRQRFGLPDDYPMTAAEYRDRRSAMAKASGLGRSRASER